MNTYTIDMKLPSLNEYVNMCRSNRYQAASFKKRIEEEIILFLSKMPKYVNPIKITFTWVEGNKKRDYDNICFAKKFILDAMVKAGKLKDDNRKCVTAFTDKFAQGTHTRVILEIEEVPEVKIDCNVFNKCEIHHNCTVEIWENTETGKISIGWYENG